MVARWVTERVCLFPRSNEVCIWERLIHQDNLACAWERLIHRDNQACAWEQRDKATTRAI